MEVPTKHQCQEQQQQGGCRSSTHCSRHHGKYFEKQNNEWNVSNSATTKQAALQLRVSAFQLLQLVEAEDLAVVRRQMFDLREIQAELRPPVHPNFPKYLGNLSFG